MNRQSLIQQGITFLQNSSSQKLPFSEQVKFLEEKGLSSDEIKHVVESVSPKQDGWMWKFLYPSIIIGAGCMAYVLSKAMEEEVW